MNLAMAMGVEAGELMDLFRWHSEDESRRFMKQKASRRAATDELADVVICALTFANRTGVDLSKAVMQKVSKKGKKYPVRQFKGRY
jgi:NTP pyrophosphatase (non-canonical NTP hydrolase)